MFVQQFQQLHQMPRQQNDLVFYHRLFLKFEGILDLVSILGVIGGNGLNFILR